MNILTTIAQNIQNSIAQTQIRNARTKAVRSALMVVSAQHPEYQGIGFDETLLLNRTTTVMDPYLNDGIVPDVNALATLWATTWTNSAESAQKAIANITPMLNDFVYVLESSDLPHKTSYSPAVAQPQSMQSNGYPASLHLRPSS